MVIFYFSTPTGAEHSEEPAVGVLGPSMVFPLVFFSPPGLKQGKIKAAELRPSGSDAAQALSPLAARREAEASGSVPSAAFSALPQRAALCRGSARPGCSQEGLNGSIIPGAAPLAEPRGSRSSAGTAGTPRARAGLARGTQLPRQGTQGSKMSRWGRKERERALPCWPLTPLGFAPSPLQ